MTIAPLQTDERRAFAEALRDFAARECGTREQRAALTDDWRETHNPEINRRLGELGYIGCAIPEAYGGAGGGATDACILLDETSYGQVPVFGMGITLIVAKAFERYGTEQQKQDALPAICAGDTAAVGISEPGAGSDAGAIACRAERCEGGWVVNGQKTWTSCAQFASRIMLVCRTDRSGSKHDGLTMLDVPLDTPGITIQPIDTLGGREVNDVFFEDVFVPEERLLGAEGRAWPQLMAGLNFERLVNAATYLGHARRAFDDALAYVREREQFGRTIGSFQAIRHRIADLSTELECCRLLVYDVAGRVDENPDQLLPREASMAKLKVTETAKRIAIEGMQLLGGAGYTTDHDMERHLRTTIVSTVVAGTSEVQRDIIAKAHAL